MPRLDGRLDIPLVKWLNSMRSIFFILCVVSFSGVAWAQKCPVMPAVSDSTVVAEWSGKKISIGNLDATIQKELCQAKLAYQMKIGELRQNALDAAVYSGLLEAEAKRLKKSSPDALLSSEVIEKIKPATEADIKAFYDQNKADIGDQKLDEVRTQIRDFIGRQKTQEAVAAYVKGLREKAKVKTSLPVFRFPVKTDGPSRGPANAKVTIVEFADYECPYCARGGEVMKEVLKKYPKDVRVVFRDFTLDFHQNAIPAAITARCAGKQGKYWEMHDMLFANMENLGEAALRGYAKKLGLDLAKYDSCIADPAWQAAIRADEEEAAQYGVEGTPAFFVNGIPLSGAQPLSKFSEIIDRELAR